MHCWWTHQGGSKKYTYPALISSGSILVIGLSDPLPLLYEMILAGHGTSTLLPSFCFLWTVSLFDGWRFVHITITTYYPSSCWHLISLDCQWVPSASCFYVYWFIYIALYIYSVLLVLFHTCTLHTKLVHMHMYTPSHTHTQPHPTPHRLYNVLRSLTTSLAIKYVQLNTHTPIHTALSPGACLGLDSWWIPFVQDSHTHKTPAGNHHLHIISQRQRQRWVCPPSVSADLCIYILSHTDSYLLTHTGTCTHTHTYEYMQMQTSSAWPFLRVEESLWSIRTVPQA